MRVVTHRGIGTGRRENSLAAFAEAIAQGATVVELDLRCTLDGQLVLAHNKDMGYWGRPDVWIPSHTHADLLCITGDSESALATFDEFCGRLPHLDTILDIKWRGGMETLRALQDYVCRHLDLEDFVRQHSLLVWLPEQYAAALRLFPGIRMVDHRIDCARAIARAICGLKAPRTGARSIVSIPAQLFRSAALARRIVNNLRTPGSTLMAYLPRNAAEVEAALTLGVDMTMTDDFTLTHALIPQQEVSSSAHVAPVHPRVCL
ncbi:MAG: glycerophosphodiester phosphodiesterase [Massilia sp.]|nr:glycerophosphodiester phosphodiesterase [Massilia sp.]